MPSSDSGDSSAAGRSESPNRRRLAKELDALAISDDYGGRRKPESKQKYAPKHLIIDDDNSGSEGDGARLFYQQQRGLQRCDDTAGSEEQELFPDDGAE